MLSSILRRLRSGKPSRLAPSRKLNIERLEDMVVPASPVDTATILLDNVVIDENQWGGSLVGSFTPHIPGSTSKTWVRLTPGAGSDNNNLFYISNKQLRTRGSFNFEAQSSFSIRVQARSSNGLVSEENFTIQVNNINERPSLPALNGALVDENSPSGTLVGSLSATDPDAGDTLTYSLVSNPGGKFQINGDRLEVAPGADLNFEQQQHFSIRVRVTDSGGLWRERGFGIRIRNVNEAPTFDLNGNSVAENSPSGAFVGWISTSDPDWNAPVTMSLVDDAGGRFRLSGNNLVVNNPGDLNYEAATSHQITLRGTDAGGLWIDRTFTINITNANEAPTDISLSNSSITLPLPNGSLVGDLTVTDPDAGGQHQFILTDNAGGKFQINGTRLEITNSEQFKWDPRNNYLVRIMVLDQSGAIFEKTFNIAVTNAAQTTPNQPPSNISLNSNSVIEGSTGGTYVSYVNASDADSWVAPTLTLVDDAGGRFELSGNNLLVKSGANLDFESASSHQITIRATDAGGLWIDRNFTINVQNVNEGPTAISLSNSTIPVPSSAGVPVGTLSATDPDQNQQFQFILINNASGKFGLQGTTLVVNDPNQFGVNPQPSYNVRVLVLDQGGLTFEQSFTITVTNPV